MNTEHPLLTKMICGLIILVSVAAMPFSFSFGYWIGSGIKSANQEKRAEEKVIPSKSEDIFIYY